METAEAYPNPQTLTFQRLKGELNAPLDESKVAMQKFYPELKPYTSPRYIQTPNFFILHHKKHLSPSQSHVQMLREKNAQSQKLALRMWLLDHFQRGSLPQKTHDLDNWNCWVQPSLKIGTFKAITKDWIVKAWRDWGLPNKYMPSKEQKHMAKFHQDLMHVKNVLCISKYAVCISTKNSICQYTMLYNYQTCIRIISTESKLKPPHFPRICLTKPGSAPLRLRWQQHAGVLQCRCPWATNCWAVS